MIRDLNKLVDELKTYFPVFETDIKKDEVEKYPSFFIYNADGEITRAITGVTQYKTSFYLSFFTKESKDLNQLEIIAKCRKHGLIFEKTEIQYGKFSDLDVDVKMITFNFHHLDKVI